MLQEIKSECLKPTSFQFAFTILLTIVSIIITTLPSQASGQSYCRGPDNSTLNLTIAALFPITGWWPGGEALRIVTEMAISDVNERPDIIPGYQLSMEWNDTEVSYLYIFLY